MLDEEVGGAGEGRGEHWTTLTFITLKGHSEQPASSSLSLYDELRHSTIWWRPGTITPVIISQNPFRLTSAVDAHYSR